MTIQEVLQSGLQYRRKGWQAWLENNKTWVHAPLTYDDIMADDWEVLKVPREWTVIATMTLGGAQQLLVEGPVIEKDEWPKLREVLPE